MCRGFAAQPLKVKENFMRKKNTALLLLSLILISITACGTKTKPAEPVKNSIKVIAAIFPAYDWTKNILGEDPAGMELTLLTDSGVDLHSYQPSVEDILSVSTCDLFIYVGGESDQWVTDALKQAVNPNMRVIKMLDVLGDTAKEEKTLEGMQAEEEDDEETEYDEHVWLSLRNAERICDAITAELSALDPANAAVYQKNSAAYKEKLSELDQAYERTVSESSLKTLLFGDRFPFRYLADDYGLTCYAAFSGCSAETEASFETISFLAGKMDELSLPAVMTIEKTDQRIARTIVQNTQAKDQQILTLNSMQSVSAKDMADGVTYLSVMADNLAVLEKALEKEEN